MQAFAQIGIHLVLWSTIVYARKSRECPPYPHVTLKNGKISISADKKLLFQCDPGYFLTSPPQVRCWRGKWTSNKEPKCLKSEGQCDEPEAILNGEIHGSDWSVGSTVQYMCKPGHLLLGKGTRECLKGSHWSGVTPACMDESEPLETVSERLKDSFVTNLTSHNKNGSVREGRLLDRDSLHQGLELVILLDRSSSIDEEDFKTAINFVKFLIQEFGVRNGNNNTVGTRVAVLTFGTKVDMLFNLDNTSITGPLAANDVLDTVKAGGGGTALEAALTSVFTLLAPVREKAKKAIFLMTDGEPNIGTPGITPEDVAIQLKDAGGFEIFTLGVGRGINRKLLSSLASPPLLNHVFILEKYSDLKSIMKAIQDSPPETRKISSGRCGYIKSEEFYLKKWPWLAVIYVSYPEGLRFCSGTLICSEWVLTAASCFNNNKNGTKYEAVFVVLGASSVVERYGYQINFYAVKVVLHPGFNHNNRFQDNLALLKLNSPVPLSRFRPACLPPTDKMVPLHLHLNINASIAGWGLPIPNTDSINGATILFNRETVPVELAEQHECRRNAGRFFNENLFCAGFGKQSCTGDLGSPIIALDPDTQLHHVIGVLSAKEKCEQGLNQYTELTSFIPWIYRVTDKCHLKHWMA